MRQAIVLSTLIVAALIIASGCCPVNPKPQSVVAAHGNTDWHIDTAEEFLFGTDMGGSPTAANHCPATWDRTHIHVGLTGTNHYYYDNDLTIPGDDADPTNGIEQAMLFFYAGHGSPTLWNTLGNNAAQGNMSLGDCPGGGMLRYYWQCSCEVFAHGPHTCPGSSWAYGCPGDFDGSPDSATMRNVYERWGPVLEPDLRMACGASTSAYCHEWVTNKIWDLYNNLGYTVAESFLFGLAWYDVVPLCITLGGSSTAATPLFDAAFTNAANTSGTSHYHIMYIVYSGSSRAVSSAASAAPEEIPEELPVLALEASPLPSRLESRRLQREGDLLVSAERVDDRPEVKVDRRSGAVYLRFQRPSVATRALLSEEQYLERARSFLESQSLSETLTAAPVEMRLMTRSAPVARPGEQAPAQQHNVVITLKRQIEVAGTRVDVLGAGGQMTVQMANDGSVVSAAKVWRSVTGTSKMARVKRYEEALAEAMEQLAEPEAYKLDRWMWGYKEAAGAVEQKEMRVVFQFAFVPADPDRLIDYPPRVVEIAGQVE